MQVEALPVPKCPENLAVAYQTAAPQTDLVVLQRVASLAVGPGVNQEAVAWAHYWLVLQFWSHLLSPHLFLKSDKQFSILKFSGLKTILTTFGFVGNVGLCQCCLGCCGGTLGDTGCGSCLGHCLHLVLWDDLDIATLWFCPGGFSCTGIVEVWFAFCGFSFYPKFLV